MFIELVEAWRVHRIVSSENGKGYFLQKKCIFFAGKVWRLKINAYLCNAKR